MMHTEAGDLVLLVIGSVSQRSIQYTIVDHWMGIGLMLAHIKQLRRWVT